MKIKIFLVLVMICLPFTALAQSVAITFAWDKGDPVPNAAEPTGYKLYICSDSALTKCLAPIDTALTLSGNASFASGQYYVFVRAYAPQILVDGTPSGEMMESGNSNVLGIKIQIPPGNPKNFKVITTNLADSSFRYTAYWVE